MLPSKHKHLVNSTSGEIIEVRLDLENAHQFLVDQCEKKLPERSIYNMQWGIKMKRIEVDLPLLERPKLIGKNKERLSEVVNILATVERLIDALRWFEKQPEFCNLRVAVYNPSTSSNKKKADIDNDLILCDGADTHVVLCEVCDVASSKAGQNGKEKSELKSLGCELEVPDDGKVRFICTSTQFAEALESEKRTKTYYEYKKWLEGENPDETSILEVVKHPTFP